MQHLWQRTLWLKNFARHHRRARSDTGYTRLRRDFGVTGIALGRDFNTDGSVDVLGTQLEEVVE
jgi:hypothetical protein